MFGVPVKSKNSADMKVAFDEVFKQMPSFPSAIYTDRGLEFQSTEMKNYFKELGVEQYAAKNSKIKAALAERAIRTIKTRSLILLNK
jgi:hypothetical protein